MRWSILIGNFDGHTSELRCSLPIHVLDNRLAEEARAATLATRRLLLGATDVEGGEAVLGEANEEDTEALPSYPSHVRDRVANAYLPDAATMRVANSWVVNGMSPTIPERSAQMPAGYYEVSSGMHSPATFETWQVGPGLSRPPRSEHLPHEPQPGATPLEWVNTELLLSLGQEAPEAPPTVLTRTTPPSRTPPEVSALASRHGSRFQSRRGSRANSRVNSRSGSPERSSADLSSASTSTTAANGAETASRASLRAEDTFVHSHSTASRNMHGLFHIAMKPFTSLTSTFSLSGARTGSHAAAFSASATGGSPAGGGSGAATPATVPEPMTSQEMLHHAFTQVPDYDMASRGFLGGGITPLSSLRELPTYESVQAEMRAARGANGTAGAVAAGERSFSEGDLAGMFAAAAANAGAGARTRTRTRTAGGQIHGQGHGSGPLARSELGRVPVLTP